MAGTRHVEHLLFLQRKNRARVQEHHGGIILGLVVRKQRDATNVEDLIRHFV